MSAVSIALRTGSGVVVWSLHFAIVYGGTALACARGWPGAVPWVIGIATAVGAGLAGTIIARERHRGHGFESWLAMWLAGFALLAILMEGIPVMLLAPCE